MFEIDGAVALRVGRTQCGHYVLAVSPRTKYMVTILDMSLIRMVKIHFGAIEDSVESNFKLTKASKSMDTD